MTKERLEELERRHNNRPDALPVRASVVSDDMTVGELRDLISAARLNAALVEELDLMERFYCGDNTGRTQDEWNDLTERLREARERRKALAASLGVELEGGGR